MTFLPKYIYYSTFNGIENNDKNSLGNIMFNIEIISNRQKIQETKPDLFHSLFSTEWGDKDVTEMNIII